MDQPTEPRPFHQILFGRDDERRTGNAQGMDMEGIEEGRQDHAMDQSDDMDLSR